MLLFVDFEAARQARLLKQGIEGRAYCFIYEIMGGRVICEEHVLGRFTNNVVRATVGQNRGRIEIVISSIVDGAMSESSLSRQLGGR